MSDYDAIKETVFHYFEGYRDKDRERLEKAFSLEIANMMGYIKNEEGKLELFSMTMRESIDKWVAPDYTPFEFSDGNIKAHTARPHAKGGIGSQAAVGHPAGESST